MNEHLCKILAKLNQNEDCGNVFLQNGTILICEDSSSSAFTYLHSLFPPLNYPEVKKIETLLKVKLPLEYKEFLLSYNGMNIFENSIYIYGLSKKNVRNSFKDVFQPTDIIIENLLLKNKDYYRFAAISNGDELYFTKKETNRVYLKKKDDNSYVQSFFSFNDWLEQTVINFQNKIKEIKEIKL